MTDIEYAIEALENLKGMVEDSVGTDYDKAFMIAIESMKKRIPMRPIYSEWEYGYSYSRDDYLYATKAECPICGNEFIFGTWNNKENHHCECGQEMLWVSDEMWKFVEVSE